MTTKPLLLNFFMLIAIWGFSSEIALAPADTSGISIFNLKNTNESLTWLGVDCSLYRIKSNRNIAQDDKLRTVLLEGIPFFHRHHMSYKQLADWLGLKKERINSQIEFGLNQTKTKLPKYWILPDCECYYLRQDNIIKHIKTYTIEGYGMALVLIPEMTNMHEHLNYSWLVFFDLETKDIIWMNRSVTPQKLNDTPRRGHFGTEWLFIIKDFIDGTYRKNLD